jgi:hypothetical protein
MKSKKCSIGVFECARNKRCFFALVDRSINTVLSVGFTGASWACAFQFDGIWGIRGTQLRVGGGALNVGPL